MKKAIIFDIDGTLANNKHRVHWLEGEKKDWDKFYSEMDKDTPNKPIVMIFISLLMNIKPSYKIICVSGRPEKYKHLTLKWFEEKIGFAPNELYMRPDGDHRPDYQVKQEILDALKADGYEILFTVDDRKQVVDMWRRNGITCLQCAEGDF